MIIWKCDYISRWDCRIHSYYDEFYIYEIEQQSSGICYFCIYRLDGEPSKEVVRNVEFQSIQKAKISIERLIRINQLGLFTEIESC